MDTVLAGCALDEQSDAGTSAAVIGPENHLMIRARTREDEPLDLHAQGVVGV